MKELKISLEAARVQAGYNKEKACKLLGISLPTLTAIEQGKRRIKPIELAGLCTLYGIDPRHLDTQRKPTHA